VTQSATWFLEAGDGILSGMGPQTQAFVAGFLEEIDGLEGPDLTYVQVAHGLAPQALTLRHVSERSPYSNPEATHEAMNAAVNRGWLEQVGEGQYVLSARGEEMAAGFFARADEFIGALAQASSVNLERIVVLLQKMVDQARRLPEPREKPALALGALFDRGAAAPLMVQVRRRLLDLFAFRDDTHAAAWQPYDISGHAWEAFTYLWRGQAGSAAELAKELPYRNYDEAAYSAALQDLAVRGWIVEQDGRWVCTQAGQELRQQAEYVTDRTFDAAWMALDESEVEELRALLERLADVVTPPE
jgi:DNA-binding MarR family transcriptional regulator